MKLGLGLYRHMLNDEYYSFAVQAGCTHVIVHLVDYFRQGQTNALIIHPTISPRAAKISRGALPAIPTGYGLPPS